MTGTAVAKQSMTEFVVEGAGLDGAVWQPARVAALQKLLPPKFQGSPENLIALASLVDRTGLDPFIKELYCWEDKGRVTYHVGRDGWLKIAKRDPDIASVASGVIFENDDFSYVRDEDGRIHIRHEGGFPQGELLGAWAVARPVDGSDQLVTRELSYYKHLLRKDNWGNYPAEMLETRVLATAIKFVSQLAAGLYAPGEAPDDNYTPTQPAGVELTQAAPQRLADKLRGPEPVEVEVEVVETAPAAEEPAETVESEPVPPSDPPMEYLCEFCGATYDTPQGRSSHLRTHKTEREMVKAWKNVGYDLVFGDGLWSAVELETGEIVSHCETFEDLIAEMDDVKTEPNIPSIKAEKAVEKMNGELDRNIHNKSVTEVYKAMSEGGPDCDQDWLDATLGLMFPEKLPDDADKVTLWHLTDEDRGLLVEKIRDTFGQ